MKGNEEAASEAMSSNAGLLAIPATALSEDDDNEPSSSPSSSSYRVFRWLLAVDSSALFSLLSLGIQRIRAATTATTATATSTAMTATGTAAASMNAIGTTTAAASTTTSAFPDKNPVDIFPAFIVERLYVRLYQAATRVSIDPRHTAIRDNAQVQVTHQQQQHQQQQQQQHHHHHHHQQQQQLTHLFFAYTANDLLLSSHPSFVYSPELGDPPCPVVVITSTPTRRLRLYKH